MGITKKLVPVAVVALAGGALLGGCAKGQSSGEGTNAAKSGAAAPKYAPKTRTINMFAAPVWIGEMADIPAYKEFAPKDFKKGGLNDGNEVFAWQPQSIYSCAGDTINLSIANPGPDDHTFTMPDLSINTPIPTGKATDVTINATKAGIFEYYCTVAEHTRYMHGDLVVFADTDPVCGGA